MSHLVLWSLLAFGSLSLVGGCAGNVKVPRSELDARRGELDKVTVTFVAPSGCQAVGNVFADDFNVGRIDRATETARMRAQLRALELGANYLHAPPAQLVYGQYGPSGAMIQGVAYRCPTADGAFAAAAPVVVLGAVKPTEVVVERVAPKADGCERGDALVVRNARGSTVEAIEDLKKEASVRRTNYAHIVTVDRPQLSEIVVNATTYRCPVR